MTGHSSTGSGLWIPPDFMAAFGVTVKDETGSTQLPNYLIRCEAGEPWHQDTLTGMRTSTVAGAEVCNEDGRGSPCS